MVYCNLFTTSSELISHHDQALLLNIVIYKSPPGVARSMQITHARAAPNSLCNVHSNIFERIFKYFLCPALFVTITSGATCATESPLLIAQ